MEIMEHLKQVEETKRAERAEQQNLINKIKQEQQNLMKEIKQEQKPKRKKKIEIITENYDRQKENILNYEPHNRRQKQIKTISIYLYYMVKLQDQIGRKYIKINPKARPLLMSENVIKELWKMDNSELKKLATSILISSWNKGGLYETKNKILDSINARKRLYKGIEHKRTKQNRTYKTEQRTEEPENRRAEKLGEQREKKERKPARIVRDTVLNWYLNRTDTENHRQILLYNRRKKAENIAKNNIKHKADEDRRKQAERHRKQKAISKLISKL